MKFWLTAKKVKDYACLGGILTKILVRDLVEDIVKRAWSKACKRP